MREERGKMQEEMKIAVDIGGGGGVGGGGGGGVGEKVNHIPAGAASQHRS